MWVKNLLNSIIDVEECILVKAYKYMLISLSAMRGEVGYSVILMTT